MLCSMLFLMKKNEYDGDAASRDRGILAAAPRDPKAPSGYFKMLWLACEL